MKCLYPIEVKAPGNHHLYQTVRCGQCANCRITRNQEWSARILMEARLHPESVFTTLTYSPDALPADYSLVPDHVTLWLKRLRKTLYGSQKGALRYFLVGEYGSRTHRPHYHAVLFGVGPDVAPIIESTWGYGYTKTDEMTMGRAGYVAQYTLKKMTKPDDFPDGRQPEFARMSRMPGLGHGYIEALAQAIVRTKTIDDVTAKVIRLDGKKWPLDRYIKQKLFQRLNREAPVETGRLLAEHLRKIYHLNQSTREQLDEEAQKLAQAREAARRTLQARLRAKAL